METLAATISANDITMDNDSPDNDISDKDFISEMENSDNGHAHEDQPEKKYAAKGYIATGIEDKKASPVSPADPSGNGSPSRSQRARDPEQESQHRRPGRLLAQDPTGLFEFPTNKDVTLSRHGQDGAASSNRNQG